MLSLFELLVLTHFIVDWIFQTKWEAMQKSKKWLPLLVHSSVYTMGFIPVFWWFNVNYYWLALLFFFHFVLDRRTLEIWIMEKIKRTKKEDVPESLWWILLIAIDQILHISILAAIVAFS